MSNRRAFVTAGVGILAWGLAPHRARAQSRTGRILVGAPPGSQLDIVARLLAEQMREGAEPSFIVDNKPGATGRIAIAQLKASAPDGQTLLIVPSGWLTTIPHMRKSNPYDAMTDFTPVAKLCSFDFALAVGPATPAKSLPEFVAWAKAHPKQANLSVPIPGGTLELLARTFSRNASLQAEVVAYKGGGGDFRGDIIAGRVPAGLALLSDFGAEHQAGRVRVVATTGTTRSPVVPGVPTFRELGFPDLVAREWFGIVGPAGMPAAVRDRLAAKVETALQSPALADRLTRMGLEPTPQSGAAFDQDIQEEYRRWRETVRQVGFEPIE
ncbi:hypothetical protein JI739_02640 [Ramlibacter sp. AW1]|uniref:Tripartite tricarboxylate transporter substrate binding protein n=1 Tax=Ramlibacter aurantiacus TaxID=2801330 RepID=A0A936ZK67_9BURK|nr:tripartite tricarboxylate transporter substrate-binding protein [Ramlibacter aurantiacus]MBL0419236.1 hypothetical protein [Ramlibacter aurantiacus]